MKDQLPADVMELAARVFAMAREGHTATLREYLASGVPVNLTNDSGDSLLMLAAYHGHTDTVMMLLDEGADPDRLNDRGQSPLAGAVFKGELGIATALVRAGANPDGGQPSARDTARMFERAEYTELFELN